MLQAEVNANKTAVGQSSLCNAITEMGSRLTHLHLAHNRLSGIPQIVKALSVSNAMQSALYDSCSVRKWVLSPSIPHTDILSESGAAGSVECKHHCHIARYSPHRATTAGLPEAKNTADNQFAHQPEHGYAARAGKQSRSTVNR